MVKLQLDQPMASRAFIGQMLNISNAFIIRYQLKIDNKKSMYIIAIQTVSTIIIWGDL